MEKKKNYVEFIDEGVFCENDMWNAFDHSYGFYKGDGLFCWPNRFGKKTFANSNRDGELDLLVICKESEIEIIDGDCQLDCVKEHEKDGKPRFQSPGIEDLVPFVTMLKYDDPPIIYDEAGFLINRLLVPSNGYTPREENIYYRHRRCLPSKFTELAKTMPYRDFLQTPYWRLVSDEKKSEKKKCEICGSSDRLEVHHTSYDIRGEETKHMDTLQVLCHDCHSKVHGKEK